MLSSLRATFFDNAWEAVEEPEQIAAVLRGIRSRYGVYAVYGNHRHRGAHPGGLHLPRRREKSRAARDGRLSHVREHPSPCATRPCCSAARFIFTAAPTRSARGHGIECAKRLRSSSRDWTRASPFWSSTTSRASWRRWPRRAWTSISAGTRTTGRCSPGNLTVRLFWGECLRLSPRGVDAQHRDLGRRSLRAEYMRVATRAEICPITIRFAG